MQTSLVHDIVVGTPIIYDQFQNSVNRYLLDSASHQCQYPTKHQSKGKTLFSETIKRTLSLGAQILQVGGVEKVFMQYFSLRKGERLLKASQCYLSTTSGPLAGLLFISTEKVAFCSEKGQMCSILYKVAIPLKKIKCVRQSQNVEKPTQKYINIVTEDNFDFWFLGVLKYQKTFKYLEQAIFKQA